MTTIELNMSRNGVYRNGYAPKRPASDHWTGNFILRVTLQTTTGSARLPVICPRCIVDLIGGYVSCLFVFVYYSIIMPNTSCCVPYCHSASKRHTHLSMHTLPRDDATKRQWAALIRNETLRVNSRGTSVCGLHFVGGRRTYDTRLPSIFPWTSEWSEVVHAYNVKATLAAKRLSDHVYCAKPLKACLLTLDIPPTLSTCPRVGSNSSPTITAAATTTQDHTDVRAILFS